MNLLVFLNVARRSALRKFRDIQSGVSLRENRILVSYYLAPGAKQRITDAERNGLVVPLERIPNCLRTAEFENSFLSAFLQEVAPRVDCVVLVKGFQTQASYVLAKADVVVDCSSHRPQVIKSRTGKVGWLPGFTEENPDWQKDEAAPPRVKVASQAPITALQSQVGGDHYKAMPIQPVQFIHANGIGYMEGCAIKYLCRHGRKGGREDLEKAIHFIQLLIEQEYSDGKQRGGGR